MTDWDVYHNITTLVKHNYIVYNDAGNISKKSDLGAFTLKYGGEKEDGTGARSQTKVGIANGALIGPHALTTISGVPSIFPQAEQPNYPTAELSVTYTDFKKIATLKEKNKDYYLTYGVDDQRRKSEYYANGLSQGIPTLTRYYIGDYEEEVLANGNVRKIHYLSGAIFIQETNQPDKFYYTYADYQGSLIALTDESGIILKDGEVEIGRFAYDPWGARRNPTDWTQKDSRTSWIITRGYTGHEHLDAFGIINMNGRVYDPLTAMFFSPDPYIQSPEDWLNYNRYGYCYGNPFKYTDPSGEFIWIIPNVGWSKSGGLSIGISLVIGIPGGLSAQVGIGYNFGSNDAYGYVGATISMNTVYASYSSSSGGSVGYTAGLSLFSGLPISTNFGTVGANYNISHNSFSGNISAWQINQNGWTFNPSFSVAVLPEHTTNFVRGQGFRSNDNVLSKFIAANNHQGALDYWGIKGSYNPNHAGSKAIETDGVIGKKGAYYGYTDSKGNIFYGDDAFSSYDNLYGTYYKESYTSNQIKKGAGVETCNYCGKDQKLYPEEAKGFRYAARNRGLYSDSQVDQLGQANSYWMQAYGEVFITNQWVYNTIYKIPRLW
ncbi:MAG: hypothetical protein PHS59_09325 [Paludibacter sp.]|nr:hypothetical protein [Paludibacter sp.]